VGCLLCGGTRFTPRFAHSGYTVQTCGDCGLTQLFPPPDDATIAGLYGADYYDSESGRGYAGYAAQEVEHQATFRDDLRRIQSFFPETRKLRILDVGCGPGAFLSVALEAGHDAIGIDIIPSVVEQAQRRFAERVHLARVADVPQFTPEPFDVVYASHVIEHIPDPIAFTEACASLLRDDGLVVFVTPNIRSWLARLSGRRWVSFKIPEHVAYYEPMTIAHLFLRSGLQPVVTDSAYEHHNLEFLAERVRRLVRPLDRLVPPIERTAPLRGRVLKVTSGSMRAIARVESRP
jgi:2-polyprenyl-3-methyl-5-hydroxy-6-metoxy-1,4-benzoquinol methylase